jgi:uncharacterized protein DUF6582/Mu-like prophage I protein
MPSAAKTPYGPKSDVDYADPGLQGDGVARYPCDTEEHARAAWSYINMPKNAAKYTPEQLARIKAKIRAALKSYGFEVEASAEPPDPPAPQEPEAPAPSGASSSPAPVTAAEAARRIHAAATRPTNQEGAGHMDPAKIREALGLAPDVSDDEVTAALVTAGLAAPPTPEPAAVPAAKPVQAAGTMTIDVSAWDEQQTRIKRLEAQAAQQSRNERDKIIGQAIEDGKFAPARKDHWVRLWDADPEGTRQVLDSLAKGVIPVMAMGYAGDKDHMDDELDRELARLTGPGVNRG